MVLMPEVSSGTSGKGPSMGNADRSISMIFDR
jgi:hypothetical protein